MKNNIILNHFMSSRLNNMHDWDHHFWCNAICMHDNVRHYFFLFFFAIRNLGFPYLFTFWSKWYKNPKIPEFSENNAIKWWNGVLIKYFNFILVGYAKSLIWLNEYKSLLKDDELAVVVVSTSFSLFWMVWSRSPTKIDTGNCTEQDHWYRRANLISINTITKIWACDAYALVSH